MMEEDASLLTKRGIVLLRRSVGAAFLLGLFSVGFWTLNQTLDAVVSLDRAYVNVPFYPVPVDVWTYHDLSFTCLWLAYAGLAAWEIAPWRHGQMKLAGVVAALLGFLLLTAGLWLAQDIMNASLLSQRSFVDFPFFVERLDLLATRDVVLLLVSGGFVLFYVLTRISATRR